MPFVVDVIEEITKLLGNTSVITTPVAGRFPLFSSSKVYEKGSPSEIFVSLTDFVMLTLAYSSRGIVTDGFGESVIIVPVGLPSFADISVEFVISVMSFERDELTLTRKAIVVMSPALTTFETTKVRGLIDVGIIGEIAPLKVK